MTAPGSRARCVGGPFRQPIRKAQTARECRIRIGDRAVEQQASSAHAAIVPPMAYTFQVTVDSADPHKLADWWADALGWQVAPSDEAFIRKMVAEGHAGEDDTTIYNRVLVWKQGAAVVHPDGTERPTAVLSGRAGEQGRQESRPP
jgi:hypothetical protein